MFKKILIYAVIVAAILSASPAVYAQNGDYGANTDDTPAFKLISAKSEIKTTESEYIVSASAEEGTSIIMSLFWFDATDGKGIVAKKKASEDKGNWLLQHTEEWTVGSSGIIAKPVTLYFGRNRIVLDITDVKGNKAQKTLEIELTTKAEASEAVSGDMIKKLLDDIGNKDN